MVPPNQSESLRQSLSRAIIDHLADALLQHPSIDRLSNPVLRFEAFIEDGLYEHEPERSIDHAVPGGSRSPSASEPVVSECSLTKFVAGMWEQIHSGTQLDARSILEHYPGSPTAPAMPLQDLGWRTTSPAALLPRTGVAGFSDAHGSFNRNNTLCRRVTQASRTYRSVEVIVQARWIEHFESYVDSLAVTSPAMSATKRRKAALMEACNDFGWHEKDMRNRMAVWRGYKEIKDAGGWAALVFAGMGIYRFCKYRIGLNPESMQCLRRLRSRIEVAADTLHPSWRQLLVLVGEPAQRRFTGHPHDWVVFPDGSNPVPLRSTYLEYDPLFSFEHLDESVVDVNAWRGDDPRWVLPLSVAACCRGLETCRKCGQEQSDNARLNSCHCFPSLFGGPRAVCPVQIFRTCDGRNNGLQALAVFERGATVGEFVGLVTKGLSDVDVMEGSVAGRSFQIWQGRQGNYTRFVNHSCKPNAQFENFVWMSTQRTILVSKGIEADQEITVDYSRSYWCGLDKRCLCGESCCRYKAIDNC
ncbi:SET domain-containing protein [Coniochaeta hoffmannii]|uniref:SET domain-containing protein n=1 Tax=Coniochaeta hoffmannii TaxID=91930 RepID=A0AA38RQC3_9PEZI|nr:SET domain-containing protein [Coniochaeta hoffmannii]